MVQKILTAIGGATGIVGVLILAGLLLSALGHAVLGVVAMVGGVSIGLALGALGVLGVLITQMKRF